MVSLCALLVTIGNHWNGLFILTVGMYYNNSGQTHIIMQPHMFMFVPIRYVATSLFPVFLLSSTNTTFQIFINTMTTFFDCYLCGEMFE